MTVSSVSLLLVITYLLVVKVVGYYAHKASKRTVDDFFVVSRSINSWMLVGTVIATMVNTLAVTGVPALVYKGGVLYFQMFVIGIVAPLLIYFFGPKIWKAGKEHGIITQAELFGHHFNSRAVVLVAALLGILAIFPFMAIQLSAVGKVFTAATNGAISYEIAVAICAISIGAYLYFGGSRAVVWTDMVQGVCFFVIIALSAILFTYWSGGVSEGFSRLQNTIPQKLQFNSKNTPLFIDNILSWPFAFFLWPQLFQRMFMANSDTEIKRSVSWNFICFNAIVLCTFTMGIMATGLLYGSLSDPDQLVASMYRKFFPLGGSLIVLAVFATGMSTVDSILLASSSIINRDIFKRVMKRAGSEEDEFKNARLIALIFLVVVTGFALSETGRGAIVPLVTLGASIATLFLWPLIGCFYWKGATEAGALSAMVLGFIAIVLMNFTSLGAMLPFGVGTAGFIVGGVSFVVVSFVTRSAISPLAAAAIVSKDPQS